MQLVCSGDYSEAGDEAKVKMVKCIYKWIYKNWFVCLIFTIFLGGVGDQNGSREEFQEVLVHPWHWPGQG